MALQLLISWVFLLLPALVCAQDSVYDRVVGISYVNTGGPDFPQYSDTFLFEQFDKVDPPITAVVPFLLNVANPSKYDKTLQGLKQRNITLIPAIGTASQPRLNAPFFKNIAMAYRNYTEYIRLELLEQYIDSPAKIKDVQAFTNYLTDTLGFKHIMLNAWPRLSGQDKVVPFSNPAVDSTILSVLTPGLNRKTDTVSANPQNWFPPTAPRIQSYYDFRKISILVNYENAPQHEALAKLPKDQQIQDMQITINQINRQNQNLHWTAPWSPNYDPTAEGTWDWIATALSKM